MSFRCFIYEQLPIPGSDAKSVRYPACEWVSENGSIDLDHPLNRFVCSWLTSDMPDESHCNEVLDVIMQIEGATRKEWFIDGDAFNIDMHAHYVQFNQSNVGPQDIAYWNLPAGRFALLEVKALLRQWRDYLVALNQN